MGLRAIFSSCQSDRKDTPPVGAYFKGICIKSQMVSLKTNDRYYE